MTIAILALITLFEGVRRVPQGSVLLQRVLFGPWRVRPGPSSLPQTRRNRLQLLSWWSPFVSTIVLAPHNSPGTWTLESLQQHLDEQRQTLLDLRILGIAILPALVIGLPLALDRFGAVGFFVALSAVGLLCLVVLEAMYSAARALGKTRKAAFGWAVPFLSPFAAPRAAEVLIEEAVRGAPPGLVVRAVLPFEEFLRWVRPYAYDQSHGETVDPRFLAGLDRRELERSLAPPETGTLWCPRCGAAFLHGERCSDCGVALLAFASPAMAGPVA